MIHSKYKGKEIGLTDGGAFNYRGPDGKVVSRPTLKAIRALIDRDASAVYVAGMNAYGEPVKILGPHPRGGFTNSQGQQIWRWENGLAWDAELARKLQSLAEAEDAERKRHRLETDRLTQERFRLIDDAAKFDYEAALQAVKAEQEAQPDEQRDADGGAG